MKAAGENSEAPAQPGLRTRDSIIYFVLLELAVGATISLGLFAVARSMENAHARQEFESDANDRREALQRSLDGTLNAVYSVKALMESSAAVSRDQFHIFAQGLLVRHPEVLSVEWLPQVARDEREVFTAQVRQSGFPQFEFQRAVSPGRFERAPECDRYFPILYMEPLLGNQATLGYDPSTEPVRGAAMVRARDSMKASATEAVPLLRPQPGDRHPRAVMCFAPVYREPPGASGTGVQPASLAGYARAVVLAQRVAQTAWGRSLRKDMETCILDPRASPQPVFSSLEELPSGAAAPELTSAQTRWRWVAEVQFADRTWELECYPSLAFATPGWGWLTRTVLGGGSVITLLGAAYVRSMLRRRQERDRADIEIRASGARFRNLFDHSPDAVFVESLEGRVLDANPAACRLQGLTRDQLIGKQASELVPPEMRSAMGREFDRLAAGEIHEMAGLSLTADGKTVPVQVRASLISHSGQPALLLSARDMTERRRADAAVQERLGLEERLSRLAATAPGAIFTFRLRPDGSSCFPYVSPRIYNVFGIAPEALREDSAPAFRLVHPADLGPLRQGIADASKALTPWKTTFRVHNDAKEWVWIEGSAMPTPEPNGDILWHGFLINVTERERAEEQLRLQSTALETAANSILLTDHDGIIRWVNPAFVRMTGYTAQEVVGRTPAILKSGRQDAAFYRELWTTILAGKVWQGELVNRRKDGSLYSEMMTITPVPGDDGSAGHFIAIKQDVTEQRKVAEKVRRERERLGRMVDKVQVGIAFVSPEGDVREINDALLRMIGWSRDDFTAHGLNWRSLIPPEFRDLDRQATQQLLHHGSAEPAERMIFHKDGSRIPVVCNGVMLPGDEGPEFAVFVVDQTEQQRLESALQDAGEAAQGRIARDLHDGLGQQLGGVLYLGRLLHQDLQQRGAAQVAQAAELNRLVKEALEMTRQVARGLHPVPAESDGLMLALEALTEMPTNGGKVEFVFECEPPVLIEDARVASHLYRIAQEAVNNALKHSHATRIEVALWQDPKAIYLSVRDDGVGLAHGPAGHGLGMYTMKHRAQLIGGLLTIENALDTGVIVSCRVPRVTHAQPREATPTPETKQNV